MDFRRICAAFFCGLFPVPHREFAPDTASLLHVSRRFPTLLTLAKVLANPGRIEFVERCFFRI
jgi:hypothetical protein